MAQYPILYRREMNHLVWPALRSSYTMRTKYAISDAFVRDCVFAYCASVAQYVYSLSAEHCFRLRNNAISDERVRDCALSTHSVFRPLLSCDRDSAFTATVTAEDDNGGENAKKGTAKLTVRPIPLISMAGLLGLWCDIKYLEMSAKCLRPENWFASGICSMLIPCHRQWSHTYNQSTIDHNQ